MAERPGDAPKLELDDVHKSFGDKPVLQGLDLTVNEHEVVCLIGPSGCGKSTILRCIDLLDPIDSGSILLDGVDITGPRVNSACSIPALSSVNGLRIPIRMG